MEDLQVYFTETDQKTIDCAITVKTKSVETLNVYLDVEPVPFNKGFYSVDITFFFLVKLLAHTMPLAQPVAVCGVATFSKKVILYGSEGNVKIFSSGYPNGMLPPTTNMPKATVQLVDPICLACRLVDCPELAVDTRISMPAEIAAQFEGDFGCVIPTKLVYITLGLFTIVQLERSVQMMIPAYDYCIPDKECVSATTDDPCELFKKIKFPTNEFFPPRLNEMDCED